MTLSALTVFLDGEEVPVQITDWDVGKGLVVDANR